MEERYLRFFGRFFATVGDQPIKITSLKNQALLAWLGLQPDTAFSRDFLATLLWPDHDPKRSANNLRKSLSRLNKQLPDLFVNGPGIVQTPVAAHWQCDVLQFEQAIEDGQWREAIALVAGEFLLGHEGDSAEFEEWLLLKREHLRRQLLKAFAEQTAVELSAGNYDDAYKYAWQRVERDPLNEAAHRDTMRALALDGRQSEAIACYERLTTLLDDELGLEPASETTDLYLQIVDGTYDTRETHAIPTNLPTPNNLPRRHSKFIGRERLIEQATQQLRDANCSLLTLVGIGGVGKTRLSIAIAEALLPDFPDGVWFIPLESVRSEAGIVDAVAAAVGIEISTRMFNPANRLAHVVNQIKSRQLLLVLDNYESVIDHVAFVQALIAEAAQVKIVVTSRERLRLQSEWVLSIDGLPFPQEDIEDGARQFAAVALFETAAQRIGTTLDLENQTTSHAIGRITRDVGGIPLAIELAAAWCVTFSAETIADRITSSIDFLATQMRDATPRHRSIRAVFEQTLAMLSPDEQAHFDRLAVFAGGFTVAAAEQILNMSVAILDGLVARALLIFDGDRYSMHPMIRQFAVEQWELNSAETQQQVSQAHAGYFATWINTFDALYKPATRRRIQPDIDNVRAAWRWASANQNVALLSQLRPNLFAYSNFAGLHHALFETFGTTEGELSAVAKPSAELLETRARILLDMAEVSYKFSRFEEAITQAQTVEQIAFQTEDERLLVRAYARMIGCKNMLGQRDDVAELGQKALAAVLADDEDGQALIYGQLSTSAEFDGNGELALEHSQKEVNILRRINDLPRLALALVYLGIGYARTGQPDKRVALTQEAYEIYRDAEITYESVGAGINLAVGLTEAGDFAAAARLYEQLIVAARKINEQRMIAVILWNMSDVYLCTRKYDAGLTYAYEAIDVYAATEDKFGATGAQETLALFYARMGDFAAAQEPFAVAMQGYDEGGFTVSLEAIHSRIGNAAVSFGELETARRHAAVASDLLANSDNPNHTITLLLLQGRIALATEDHATALDYFHQAKQGNAAVHGEDGLLDVLAGESLALLGSGDKPAARSVVESILPQLGDGAILNQTESVPAVYLACVEVLRACGDVRAEQVLEDGLAFLERVSAEISDPAAREKYLNNIIYNKQLRALA